MTAGRRPPEISVLMQARNAAPHLLDSVQSVLAQTFEDLELIVVDDASTDGTDAILSGIRDDRLVVRRNPTPLGMAESLNAAAAAARGRFLARLHPGDYAHATRLQQQLAVLRDDPDLVLVGSETSVLAGGRVTMPAPRGDWDPVVAAWLLHLGDPVAPSSTLCRAALLDRLGRYLDPGMGAAADFDLAHRVVAQGGVSIMPQRLTIRRQDARPDLAGGSAVLARAYRALDDADAAADAAEVARHAFGDAPTPGRALHDAIERLELLFVHRHRPAEPQRLTCAARTAEFFACRTHAPVPEAPRPIRAGHRIRQGTLQVGDERFVPEPTDPDQPPRLYVVVDTEAEFDWDHQMLPTAIAVSSIAEQVHAQAIFDRHGVRPIYTVDYAVASQEEGVGPLRAILERHGCAIGAHLHPWVNPPLEEELNERNTFAGNLPAELEERKLRVLIETIERGFGVRPLFFKAGRYGVGPNTMRTISSLGIEVDFSVMPLADMRPRGGPDYRLAGPLPYRTAGGRVLSLPMTRGQVGRLPPMPKLLHGVAHSLFGTRLRIPGILARSGLLTTVTLTPEGMTVAEQATLLRTMLDRGERVFVLHYHSSSLGANTPYVRDAADKARFLTNIEAVCDDFFHRLGGIAGNPADLVRPESRDLVWPETLSRDQDRQLATGPAAGPGSGPG